MKHKIIESLTKWGSLSIPQLQQLLGCKSVTLHKHLKELKELRYVHSTDTKPIYWAIVNTPLPNRYFQSEAHRQSVIETGIIFASKARERGDEISEWSIEVPHQYGIREEFITDAVLIYETPSDVFISLIEVDRGTETLRTLRNKVHAYYQWTKYKPKNKKNEQNLQDPTQWKRDYPGKNPPYLYFIFDCENSEKRINKFMKWLETDPIMNEIRVYALTIEDLKNKDLTDEIASHIPTGSKFSLI